MDFSSPKPRRQAEPALPMINVVFLLLIFFLMSAQIVSPPPFEVTPPTSEDMKGAGTDLRLHVSAQAELALGDISGDAAFQALSAVENPEDIPLLIRADAALPAKVLARLLARISELGFENVQLATTPR